MTQSAYKYLAFIDEAGDDGLARVRPLHPDGSSEWLVLSAVVVRASREDEVVQWVSDIVDALDLRQTRHLHFAKLTERRKRLACEMLAGLSARYFVVCSNKKNMQGWRNRRAEQVPARNWFYCWMTRLLMERVTDYIAWRSVKDHGSLEKVRIEFSNRGGMSYAQLKAYYHWLRNQGERTYLRQGRVHWQTLESELLRVYPHQERAGLQLADVVASAFFKACDLHQTSGCDPQFAKLLEPRMARANDRPANPIAGYGVKLMPGFGRADLLDAQAEIYKFYGYPGEWWAPDPSDP